MQFNHSFILVFNLCLFTFKHSMLNTFSTLALTLCSPKSRGAHQKHKEQGKSRGKTRQQMLEVLCTAKKVGGFIAAGLYHRHGAFVKKLAWPDRPY